MVLHTMPGHDPSGFHADTPAGSNLAVIRDIILADREPHQDDRGFLVATDCLYFDGAGVTVRIQVGPRGEHVSVSDEGNALDRVVAAGRTPNRGEKVTRAIAKQFGLRSDGMVITSGAIAPDDLPAVIALVANASQDLAVRLFAGSEAARSRDILAELSQALPEWFGAIVVHPNISVVGASHREYRFDLGTVVEERAILFDVLRHRNTNSVLAANFDVSRNKEVNAARIVVYDPDKQEEIGSPNLSLIAAVAPTISFDDLNPQRILRNLRAS